MKCKEPGCGKEIIFGITQRGRFIPIDFSSVTDADLDWLAKRINDREPLQFRYGEHIAHFATCTNPKGFRKKDDSS